MGTIKVTKRVELDYCTQDYSANPILDAEAWVGGDLDADVDVSMVTEHGPGGGNPVLAFEGEPAEVRKVLEAYYADAPEDLELALAQLA